MCFLYSKFLPVLSHILIELRSPYSMKTAFHGGDYCWDKNPLFKEK